MHPAASIIVFSTLSGAGYGLAAMLGLGLLDPASAGAKAAHLTALGLIAAGLLASTFHLGNPRRAWRALTQWRTSWLSREGLLAVLAFPPLLAAAGLSWIADSFWWPLGLLAAALCGATVYCTGMIYGSIRAVDLWHTPLTPLCYLLFALSSGLVLATAFGSNAFSAAIGAITLAWAAKWAWRRRAHDPARSSPETATGLGRLGAVRLFEAPHMTENYLTREMGFRVARKHAGKLWRIALIAGCLAPALLLVAGAYAPAWPAVIASASAALLHLGGLLTERWLFFAEARHALSNYYGR